MKLLYKYTSDIIHINSVESVNEIILKNFKKIRNYDIVNANIKVEGKTICKAMFVKDAINKNDVLIDNNTIDPTYIFAQGIPYNTISCSRCGKVYLYDINTEVEYKDFLGCHCYSPDCEFNINETDCEFHHNFMYVLNPELDIIIEYYVYNY
jgi:hypothetical protein